MALQRLQASARLTCILPQGLANEHRCFSIYNSFQAEDSEYLDNSWTKEQEAPTNYQEKQIVQRIIRANLLSELAAAKFAYGQSCSQRDRPDLAHRQERESTLLQEIEALAPLLRARPSLLRPVLQAVGFSLGAASNLLPRKTSNAVSGAVQEALTEQYNDQLRDLRENGLSEKYSELKEAVKRLRDEERAPADAIPAPDLTKLRRPHDLSPEEIVAGAVKYSLKGLFSLGSRI